MRQIRRVSRERIVLLFVVCLRSIRSNGEGGREEANRGDESRENRMFRFLPREKDRNREGNCEGRSLRKMMRGNGICNLLILPSFESLLLFELFVNFCLSSIYDYNARFRKRRSLVINFFHANGMSCSVQIIFISSFTFVSACCYKNWAKLWKFCQIDYLEFFFIHEVVRRYENSFSLSYKMNARYSQWIYSYLFSSLFTD